MGNLINDASLAERKANLKFHLLILPGEVPSHLLRYVPNLHYSSQLLGKERYIVAGVAAEDLEVKDGTPVELLADYSRQPIKLGYPFW